MSRVLLPGDPGIEKAVSTWYKSSYDTEHFQTIDDQHPIVQFRK